MFVKRGFPIVMISRLMQRLNYHETSSDVNLVGRNWIAEARQENRTHSTEVTNPLDTSIM